MDEIEDYLESKSERAQEQIRESYAEYRRGQGRNAFEFLAESKKPERKQR